jgi:high-affinity nickel-transport protein
MSLAAILTLGFFLGMRHATDVDHVVAVIAIVSRERSLRAAVPVGVHWGVGHTVTILIVGGAIILLGLVIPARLGLGMEMAVAFMLVGLGAMNVRSFLFNRPGVANADRRPRPRASRRPLFVGIVHGLAGSAAIALLVLGTVRDPWWGLGYLLVFGMGTIAGMLLITTALAVPVAVAARRFERFHRVLGVVTGVASVAFGVVLAYEVGFVHGFFTSQPDWHPQ